MKKIIIVMAAVCVGITAIAKPCLPDVHPGTWQPACVLALND